MPEPNKPQDQTGKPSVDVQNLIKQLRLAQEAQNAGGPPDQHKPIEEYKFWKTQPVPKFEDEVLNKDEEENAAPASTPVTQGPLETKRVEDVSTTPQSLPTGFEWATVDVTDEKQLQELYELLFGHYVADDFENFRFKYPVPFLRWALTPPGWNREFMVGIRASATKKLLAFISGTPVQLSIRKADVSSVEINFLCVHKQLRSKRMAPVLIREVTRRVNLTGVWQALFTAGTLIPTPVSQALYFHRPINWLKLYDVGFAQLEPGSTTAQEVARCAVPNEFRGEKGLRPMELRDVDEVSVLLANYLQKFELHQKFTKEELAHWLVSPKPEDNIMHAYVVEFEGQITDFISAFGIECQVAGNAKYDSIQVAYVYYYATTATGAQLKPRLDFLFRALLIELKKHGFDVLNALSIMDNPLILESVEFRPGDGALNYNLFNWKTPWISGGINKERRLLKPGGIGVVLL